MAQPALKSLDDQITIRITTDMRERIEGMSDPVTHGKPSDVARVLLEFGLRAAERHGYHNVLGVINRGEPIEMTVAALQRLIEPMTTPANPPAEVTKAGDAMQAALEKAAKTAPRRSAQKS